MDVTTVNAVTQLGFSVFIAVILVFAMIKQNNNTFKGLGDAISKLADVVEHASTTREKNEERVLVQLTSQTIWLQVLSDRMGDRHELAAEVASRVKANVDADKLSEKE